MTGKVQTRLVFVDSAVWLRIAGIIFAAAGLLTFSDRFMLIRISFVVFGVLAVLAVSDLTVTADQAAQALTLRYRYLWLFDRTKIIAFDAIEDIRVEKSSSSGKRYSSTLYRIAVILKDGRKIPFRFYYAGEGAKKNQVKKLRAFVGIVHTSRKSIEDEAPLPA